MNKNPWKLALVFLTFIFLIGCNVNTDRPSDWTPSKAPPLQSTSVTPVEPSVDSTDSTKATAEILAVETKTHENSTQEIFEVSKDCLKSQDAFFVSLLTEGTLIFADWTQKPYQGQLLSLSAGSSQPKFLKSAPNYTTPVITSPARSWLEYQISDEIQDVNRVVISRDGQIQGSIGPDKQRTRAQWLDNEHLAYLLVDETTGIVTGDEVEVWNPFTGENQRASLALPGFYSDFPRNHWEISLDPALERALYLQEGGMDGVRLVLWDLQADEELWALDKISTINSKPKWSLDGSKFAAVVLNEQEDNWNRIEIYIVDRDGDAKKLVDLKGFWPDQIGSVLEWSPDGRYLILVPYLSNGSLPALVLDTKNNNLYDFCVIGDATGRSILWSPDSTKVIVPQLFDLSIERNNSPDIVIDLENKNVAMLIENPNLKAICWMK